VITLPKKQKFLLIAHRKARKCNFNLFYCEKQKVLSGIIDKVSLQKLGGHEQGKSMIFMKIKIRV